MVNKLPNIKNKSSMTEEEKKAIVESYNGNQEGYKASLEKMPEKEHEVSLLIASACGIDIKDI